MSFDGCCVFSGMLQICLSKHYVIVWFYLRVYVSVAANGRLNGVKSIRRGVRLFCCCIRLPPKWTWRLSGNLFLRTCLIFHSCCLLLSKLYFHLLVLYLSIWIFELQPSVLWRCWLSDRKGIRPVKIVITVALLWDYRKMFYKSAPGLLLYWSIVSWSRRLLI